MCFELPVISKFQILPFQAAATLKPLVFRIYFLDGTTKGVAVETTDTALDVLTKLQKKIGLQSTHGWALYEVRFQEGSCHIMYIAILQYLPRNFDHI